MKKGKVLSIVLTIVIIISMLSAFCVPSYATYSSELHKRIETIKSVYPTGTYFTASGGPAYDWGDANNLYADSQLQNIPSRGGLPAGWETGCTGTSCWAFAQYCFYYVYGHNFYTNTFEVAQPNYGDVLYLYKYSWSYDTPYHYAIYLEENSDYYYVYDCNWDGNCNIGFYRAIPKTYFSAIRAFRSYNYDSLYFSGPVPSEPSQPSINYSNVTPGDYCIFNVGTQAYLTVDDGIDLNGQNVSVHSFCNSNAYKMSITKVSDAYKIRPLYTNRLINPASYNVTSGLNVNIWNDENDITMWWRFETYGNAYIIRNAQNPNCVLTVSGENVLVENFTGSANQQWTLHPTAETVYYNANGGTGAPAPQTKYHAVDLMLSSQIPTRSGYTFLGWSTDANATSAQYSAGGIFSHWAGATLYAVWKRNTTPTPPPHTHSYTNACDTTCDCGYVRTTTHSFGGYVYNNDASERADGTKTRTCSVCGHKETVTATGTKWKSSFTDIKTKDFYYKPTLWAVANGITTGTSKTTFSPEEPCTRGQVVTFLWRAAGCPEPKTTTMPFTDVGGKAFYKKAVLWAVEQGITSGASATTFGPNETCTRGQIATFLWRAKGKPAPKSSNMPFVDVAAKNFAYKAVLWAVENKITSGTSKTTFEPSEPCTRGQIVTFLYRAYK